MSRTQTLVQLSDRLVSLLDQRAAERGISRSQLIREAIEAHLSADLEAEAGRAIVEGYTRVPDDREFEAWAEASARDMIAEEPW
ncbi:MAG: CopG family transcriptional regulator [Acidimicrobiales bacterium]